MTRSNFVFLLTASRRRNPRSRGIFDVSELPISKCRPGGGAHYDTSAQPVGYISAKIATPMTNT